jgi:hypothetical protein
VPTPRKIYLVQTSDPSEINQVLSQVNEDVTKANENATKSGTFYTYDWEKDHTGGLK